MPSFLSCMSTFLRFSHMQSTSASLSAIIWPEMVPITQSQPACMGEDEEKGPRWWWREMDQRGLNTTRAGRSSGIGIFFFFFTSSTCRNSQNRSMQCCVIQQWVCAGDNAMLSTSIDPEKCNYLLDHTRKKIFISQGNLAQVSRARVGSFSWRIVHIVAQSKATRGNFPQLDVEKLRFPRLSGSPPPWFVAFPSLLQYCTVSQASTRPDFAQFYVSYTVKYWQVNWIKSTETKTIFSLFNHYG